MVALESPVGPWWGGRGGSCSFLGSVVQKVDARLTQDLAVKGASNLFTTVALAQRAKVNFRCVVSPVAGFGLQGIASGKEPWRGWASSPGQRLPQRVDLFIVEIMISFSTAQCCLRHESKENPGAWPLLPLPGAFSSALPCPLYLLLLFLPQTASLGPYYRPTTRNKRVFAQYHRLETARVTA